MHPEHETRLRCACMVTLMKITKFKIWQDIKGATMLYSVATDNTNQGTPEKSDATLYSPGLSSTEH